MKLRALLVLALVAAAVPAWAADARQSAWLGVRIRDLSEQEMDEIASRHGIREGFGAFIVDVLEGSPAATAGMKSGDIVVAIGERPVTETRMLQRLVAATAVDREIPITVLRPEGRQRLVVRLAPMPRPILGERIAADLGFALADSDRGLGRADDVPSGAPTIAVVTRGSAAERAGLEVGDVVLEVNGRPVVTRDAARDALADVGPDRPLNLAVRRGERRLAVTLVVK